MASQRTEIRIEVWKEQNDADGNPDAIEATAKEIAAHVQVTAKGRSGTALVTCDEGYFMEVD